MRNPRNELEQNPQQQVRSTFASRHNNHFGGFRRGIIQQYAPIAKGIGQRNDNYNEINSIIMTQPQIKSFLEHSGITMVEIIGLQEAGSKKQ